MKSQVAAFIASLTMILSGCATFNDSEGVEVSLVDLRLSDATVLETTAVFTVRLENEGPVPLRLEGGVHKFYLNGIFIGKGLTTEALEIPRFGTITQPVTVYLRNIAVASRIKPIVEGESVDYRVNSLLYGQQGDRRTKMRLSHEGTLALRDFQPSPRTSR